MKTHIGMVLNGDDSRRLRALREQYPRISDHALAKLALRLGLVQLDGDSPRIPELLTLHRIRYVVQG